MQQEQLDHSPPQCTLTQSKWIDTRKVGRDDEEIRQTKLLVESERKRKRKKDKPFARGSGGGGVQAAAEIPNTDISALTQTQVVEAVIYESSEDGEFTTKLISPREIHKLHGWIQEDEEDTNTTPLKTPTKSEKRKSNTNNPNSLLNRDLRRHIEAQNNIIAELRRKLQIIRDVSSDAKFTDTRKILRDNLQNTTDTQINILDNREEDEVVVSGTKSDTKNIINLHFN